MCNGIAQFIAKMNYHRDTVYNWAVEWSWQTSLKLLRIFALAVAISAFSKSLLHSIPTTQGMTHCLWSLWTQIEWEKLPGMHLSSLKSYPHVNVCCHQLSCTTSAWMSALTSCWFRLFKLTYSSTFQSCPLLMGNLLNSNVVRIYTVPLAKILSPLTFS